MSQIRRKDIILKMAKISTKLDWSIKLLQKQVGYGQKKSNEEVSRNKGEFLFSVSFKSVTVE